MRVQRYFFICVFAFAAIATSYAADKDGQADSLILKRVFEFASRVDTTGAAGMHTQAYQRFLISIDRRNVFLLAVPTMYAVAHGGKRKFAGEFYDDVEVISIGKTSSKRQLSVNTVPHRRKTLTTLLQYLTPEIYDETILDENLLSPFYWKNRRFYRYKFIHLDPQYTKLIFKARIDNTQLVSGRAVVETATGRIVSTDLYGEFDMVRFRLSLEMGSEGHQALFPVRCKLKSLFKFIGSKISADYSCHYGMTAALPDTVVSDSLSVWQTKALMEQIRPEPLPEAEQQVFDEYYRRYEEAERVQEEEMTKNEGEKKNLAKTIFWDILGDHMLNRIKSRFGSNDQGYIGINPILNPLYFGYSNKKGFVYKFGATMGYAFTPNRDLTIRLKTGYSFKQKQWFLFIPLRFNYNIRRHGYFAIDADYGRWIYSSDIKEEIGRAVADSLEERGMYLDRFRDAYVHVHNNYDISDRWSFNVGMIYHRREAIVPEVFKMMGRPTVYRSLAPRMEWQYRPLGWEGPVITLNYERGLKGLLKSDSEYERWEIDGSYIHAMPRLQSVSMRLGGGLFSKKSGNKYFLDFTNFRDDNLPGGWNDDWSGDFRVLSSSWYNSSRYYVRLNTTYESPLLVLSRLPWIGHFMEMERLYGGFLLADELKPYWEMGYGFTTRLMSLGIFVGNRNGHFERVGCRVGFELFRKW